MKEVAPYSEKQIGEEVIPADFKEGMHIPAEIKQQILAGEADFPETLEPGFSSSLDKATLHHATPELQAQAPGKPAFTIGTKIYAAEGRGFSLRMLFHEVTHVHQHLTIPNFSQFWKQQELFAGPMNKYQLQAEAEARAVMRANRP